MAKKRLRADLGGDIASQKNAPSWAVQVNEIEDTIFRLLKGTVEYFGLVTVLRVAGGWVRDKLLGRSCSDIDVAIDNMTGASFCEKLVEYLNYKLGCKHTFKVIQSNPDQSKHLETSRMQIFGVGLDFINLRGETYASNSRIPTMKFGTPLEDALRRDLTINSLFFNINTNCIEDLTGKGIQDLQDRIIRTPRPAEETFLDDPLRVLRAVRFGAEFGFQLDKKLENAAALQDVRSGLAAKVSRERIGLEVDKIMKGSNPVVGITKILELDLFSVTFGVSEHARVAVDVMKEVSTMLSHIDISKVKRDERRICLYSALVLPLSSLEVMNGGIEWLSRGKEKALYVLRDFLKCSKKDLSKVCEVICSACDVLQMGNSFSEGNCAKSVCSNGDLERKRVIAGNWVYGIQELWRAALVLVAALRVSILKDPIDSFQQYRSMETLIVTLDLEFVWTKKPLLNGHTVKDMLGLKEGNAEVKRWLEKIRNWQLGHSTGTQKDCLEWLQQELACVRMEYAT